MKAVILAAGKGVRLWPLTETRPKPLLPIATKPILQHTLESVVDSGIREVVIVVNYMADAIKAKLGDGASFSCEIEYARQTAPRGTADALATAQPLLKNEDRFVVVYGDDYYEKEALKDFISKAQKNDVATVATARVDDASPFGTIEAKNGRVTGIKEKEVRRRPGLVNAGLYLMTERIFTSVKKTGRSRRGEFELTDSLRMLVDQGENVRSQILEENKWLGISYPWDLLAANERAVVSGKGGAIRGEVEDGARLEGAVAIEEGTVVKAGSRLEGPLYIGKDCEIGPNTFLRQYTSVGDRVKIGAGCEVKNSIVMEKSKIPHLSYIGDSVIGEDCSLGAGTITANLRFDEASVKSKVQGLMVDSRRRKLGAILGDRVRTGINVSLFPGVKIGPRAWLGPSAIVEKDVASGARQSA